MMNLCRNFVVPSMILATVTLATVILAANPAIAQVNRGGDLVVLVTEVVISDIEGEAEEVSYWWSSASAPAWTETDEAFFASLREVGVEPMKPRQANISRIYRRPELSTVNAAQLGGLLDGKRVLVGRVEYRPIKPVAPLDFAGVAVSAEIELVAAGSSDGTSLQRFTLGRHFFDREDSKVSLAQARSHAGTVLGEVIGHSLRRAGGPIGVVSEKPLLGLRNLERAENLQILRQRLMEIEEVTAVVERWAAEGIIALEINPGDANAADISDYAIRVLENHRFDDFQLERETSPVADGIVQFWVAPRGAHF